MQIVITTAELSAALASRGGGTVALVPTMGALHSGHLALVAAAKARADFVVMSIFVNPLQFGASEDLERYPRQLDADAKLAATAGVDLLFAPTVEEIYPPGVELEHPKPGPVGELFEGANRPGHFGGMLTVVNRLFDLVKPDFAVFGTKDAQQLFLVRQLAVERNRAGKRNIEVVPLETVRESDGLALSSRNRYLTPGEREGATSLHRALSFGAKQPTPSSALQAAGTVLENEPMAKLEYLALVDEATFMPITDGFRGPARILVAAKFGTTRLIDNQSITF
ncbi:MAG: hypothetical protein RL670_1171 [Actinomycetota bacterium]|jgi:pantoate--beta-alanine ligase